MTTYHRSFERSLRAANKSPRTVQTYLEAVDQLCSFLTAQGMPTTAQGVTREHIEAYLVELLELGRAPATVSHRFRALQQFWKFFMDEGEITASPMERMTRPRVPDQPVDVLTEDDLRALLRTCSTRSFEDVRDAAVIRLLVDSGMRRAELLALRVDDLDLDQDVAVAPARAAARGPVRSGIRPARRSIGTCAHGIDTRTLHRPSSGSAGAAVQRVGTRDDAAAPRRTRRHWQGPRAPTKAYVRSPMARRWRH
jgi:site-specific recombinase XerC